MSPALNGSSAIRRFKHSDAIKIHDEITFDLYTGLPHMLILGWTQRVYCWFRGRPRGHIRSPKGNIRSPKGHSVLWKKPSENPGGIVYCCFV